MMQFRPKIQNLTIKHIYIYEENFNFKPKFQSWTSHFVQLSENQRVIIYVISA